MQYRNFLFQLFYDLDILEEKVLLEWSEKVSKKYVTKELSQEIHNRVKPFISWLKEAEEESESESEDDVEVSSLLVLYLEVIDKILMIKKFLIYFMYLFF